MKLQSIYILASAVLLMAFASCKKDLIKTNTDPNSVSVDAFDANNILTATQLYYTGSTDNAIEVEETEIQGAGCMIQHWASTSTYFFGDKYIGAPTSGGWGSFFDHTYTSTIKNAVNLYTITTGKPQYKNLHQIARIIKAMAFERITDVYGDVPYFQAGQAYNKGIYFPKYDKQKDIYADLLKEVEQATDSLDANADKPTGDLFYSQAGDQIGEWKKFGHTLLLRMAMRLTKVDPTTAKTYVTKLQGLTMTSNDDNAIVAHGTNDPLTINRIYRGIGEDGGIQLSGQISKTFIDFLKNNNDPRLPVLSYVYPPDFSPGDDPGGGSSDPADQNGLPNGYDAGNTSHGIQSYLGPPPYLGNINLYSRPSPIIFNATAPTLILTYAESEFLLADAAKRWGIGNTEEHYNNGVRAAMEQLAVFGNAGVISDNDIKTYLSAHPYDDSKGPEMINTQFWACTFFNEYEAWANYRRTGFPVLKAVTYTGSQSPGAIPRRMYYSSVDKQVNTTNYNAAAAAMGGDKIISRMWWDVQ
ncbi:SusD/RagB family nutrient-binding outer membrane lipoprotein [Mucilaginibacter sp.]|uniref:SusD/RagB family nutrient-binding outer membrane lipoprotein n=1 Tax=Mucilaginibacter sp. TaxID=1882438 RepID=UPI002621CF58|nr:SusD/RagB family nutrient-binding outer membrane lipoprotein [Mucilaginibacter sp.]MDB4918263.1 Starch-binding associating with outer rane [Mucilaginibacter sp.]